MCLTEVEKANLCIFVLGMRYGFIDEDSGKSFTHLEYDHATTLGLPRLIFLLDENNQPVLPKFVDVGESGILLRNFKNELKRKHTVVFFTTPEDLAVKMEESLQLKFEDMNAVSAKTQVDDASKIPVDSIQVFTIKGGERDHVELDLPINKNTWFYLHYKTEDDIAPILIYLKIRPDQGNEKWIGFGTVEGIGNRTIQSEHIFRIGYPSRTEQTIEVNLLDKIAESGLDISGDPSKIIQIRFRNDGDADNIVKGEYAFNSKSYLTG